MWEIPISDSEHNSREINFHTTLPTVMVLLLQNVHHNLEEIGKKIHQLSYICVNEPGIKDRTLPAECLHSGLQTDVYATMNEEITASRFRTHTCENNTSLRLLIIILHLIS